MLPFVLASELERYNRLYRKAVATLSATVDALEGREPGGAMVDEMADDLASHRVPKSWEALAYPSLRPLGSWVTDLHARVHFMGNCARGLMGDAKPVPSFWLGAFFEPDAFLLALLRRFLRGQRQKWVEVRLEQLAFMT